MAGDWATWASALDDTPSFDDVARQVGTLPAYAGAPTVEAVVQRMTQHEALVYIVRTLLADPSLRAASRRVYEANWIVRQATVLLLAAMAA